MESQVSPEKLPKDISEEFSKMEMFDFLDFLRTQRNEPNLHITADLSSLDKGQFVGQARRLKAFLETGRGTGERSATIKATEAQIQWEPNVISQ